MVNSMAESDLNKRLRDALNPKFDLRRCENAVDPGTPDINYLFGWIESKLLPAWPKRANTVVRIEHYVPAQRGWHLRRCSVGGRVWVALDVAGEFMLFHADHAAQHLGITWTRADCKEQAMLWTPSWSSAAVRKFFLDYHGLSRYSVDPSRGAQ